MHNSRSCICAGISTLTFSSSFRKSIQQQKSQGEKRKDSMKQKDFKKHFMFKCKAFEQITQAASIFMSSVLLVPQTSWFTVLPLQSHGCCGFFWHLHQSSSKASPHTFQKCTEKVSDASDFQQCSSNITYSFYEIIHPLSSPYFKQRTVLFNFQSSPKCYKYTWTDRIAEFYSIKLLHKYLTVQKKKSNFLHQYILHVRNLDHIESSLVRQSKHHSNIQ